MNLNYNKLLILILGLLILSPIYGYAKDTCSKANEIWKDRNLYDIAIQTERINKRKEFIEGLNQVDEFGQQMVNKKKEIVAAESKNREALWREYDAIDEQRDTAGALVERLSTEYSKLSAERRKKIMEFREREISARIECLSNQKLENLLDEKAREIKTDKEIPEANKASIIALINQRKALVSALESELNIKRTALNDSKANLLKMENELVPIYEKISGLEKAMELQSEAVTNSLNETNDVLVDYGNKLSDISEKILENINKK